MLQRGPGASDGTALTKYIWHDAECAAKGTIQLCVRAAVRRPRQRPCLLSPTSPLCVPILSVGWRRLTPAPCFLLPASCEPVGELRPRDVHDMLP